MTIPHSQSYQFIGAIGDDSETSALERDMALASSADGVRVIRIRDGRVSSMASGLISCDRHAWLDDCRVAVLMKRQGKRSLWRQVVILACDGPRVRTVARMETPIPAADVVVFAGRLFVCGSANGCSRLWWTDALSPEAKWQPISMPPELGQRKGIDAMAQDGRVLVAIDNIVFPKWMLRYVVDGNDCLRLDAVVEMTANGSYESVHSASSGASVFAVQSRTVGRMGVRGLLVMYRFDNLESLGGIEFDDARIDYAMQGDSLWLLDTLRPDRVICVNALALGGQTWSLRELAESDAVHHHSSPTECLVRTRWGRVLAVSAEGELPLGLPG